MDCPINFEAADSCNDELGLTSLSGVLTDGDN